MLKRCKKSECVCGSGTLRCRGEPAKLNELMVVFWSAGTSAEAKMNRVDPVTIDGDEIMVNSVWPRALSPTMPKPHDHLHVM